MKTKRFWMMAHATRILNVFAIFVCSVVVQPAVADDVCIPGDTGVPYLSGNPNWWDDSLSQPDYWPDINDPRWRGSFSHTPVPAGAATAHVTFRTLRNPTDVYMAWIVSVDPCIDQYEELWLGLSPSGTGGGTDDMLLQIIPFSSANSDIPDPAGDPLPAHAGVIVMTRTGSGNWTASGSVPTWLESANTDVRVIRKCYSDPCDGTGSWAVLMKIPLQAPPNGINLATSFDFWFAVMVTHTSGEDANGNGILDPGEDLDGDGVLDLPLVVEYDYPSVLDYNDVLVATDTTGWQAARRDKNPTDAGCIQGITLVSSDIGTVDSAGDCVPATTLSTDMKIDDGAGGPGTIVYCARPQNDGADIGTNDINATFRLANWGSTSRLTGTWDAINIPNCSLPTSDPTRACNNAPISKGNKGAITYEWKLSKAQACAYDVPSHPVDCTGEPPPTKDDHQCMLVELRGIPGVSIPISSVARNMDFVKASTFVRDAEISVPGPRDVFLYVQTNNMPPPPQKSGLSLKQDTASGRITDFPMDMGSTNVTNQPFEPPADTPPLEKSPYEELRDSEPTYQVHAFHDTGEVVNLRGKNYKLLKPQTSFGYFVNHEGQLTGWKHKLEGAQEIIAGKYYKVGVPASGKATVTTSIEAVEQRFFAVNAKIGADIPNGSFNNYVDPGVSLNLGLEYLISPSVSVEAILGYHQFGDDGLGDDLDVYQLSLNGRYYLPKMIVWPYINAGVGLYFLDPGDTELGANAGVGVQYELTPQLSIEGAYNYHHVDTSNPDVQFSTVQVGLRYQF